LDQQPKVGPFGTQRLIHAIDFILRKSSPFGVCNLRFDIVVAGGLRQCATAEKQVNRSNGFP
jgi:hypothetical protein